MFQKILGVMFLLSASSLYAGNVDVYYSAGNHLYAQGQYLLSIPYYEEVVRLDPQDWRPYQALGASEYRLGEYDKTLGHYQTSLQLNPNNPDLTRYVELLRAQPANSNSSSVAAASSNLYHQAGDQLHSSGQDLLAIPYYEAVTRQDPSDWKTYQALGDAQAKTGDARQAIASYQSSLSLNPNNPALAQTLKALTDQVAAVPPTAIPTAVPPAPAAPTVVPTLAPMPIVTAAPTAAPTEVATLPPVLPTPVISVTAVTPPITEDDRLPKAGSLTWELGAAAVLYSYTDMVSYYAPAVFTPSNPTPFETEVDLGGVYTILQRFQAGVQLQYMAKQNTVVYSTYPVTISGVPTTATASTTWSEACAGVVLEAKYLVPMDKSLRFVLSGQGGFYTLLNSNYVSQSSTYANLSLNASSIGGEISGEVEWLPDGPGWAMDFGVGYRMLSFNSITTSSASGLSSQSSLNNPPTVDFSGPRINVTARFF